jgi:hypothetical protein
MRKIRSGPYEKASEELKKKHENDRTRHIQSNVLCTVMLVKSSSKSKRHTKNCQIGLNCRNCRICTFVDLNFNFLQIPSHTCQFLHLPFRVCLQYSSSPTTISLRASFSSNCCCCCCCTIVSDLSLHNFLKEEDLTV